MISLSFLKHNNKNKTTANSREELHLSIKKTTLKSLKRIIIVNVFVLLFYIVASLLVDKESVGEEEEETLYNKLLNLLNFLLFILPIVFTAVCIWFLKSIKKDHSVLKLLKNISYARTSLKIFVFSKLTIFLFVLYSAIYEIIIEATNITTIINTFYYTILIICCAFFSILGISLMWIIYKILYRGSLKQLTKNYYTIKKLL